LHSFRIMRTIAADIADLYDYRRFYYGLYCLFQCITGEPVK
jgi:hypothetical protein